MGREFFREGWGSYEIPLRTSVGLAGPPTKSGQLLPKMHGQSSWNCDWGHQRSHRGVHRSRPGLVGSKHAENKLSLNPNMFSTGLQEGSHLRALQLRYKVVRMLPPRTSSLADLRLLSRGLLRSLDHINFIELFLELVDMTSAQFARGRGL